jgi:hypothetical protein
MLSEVGWLSNCLFIIITVPKIVGEFWDGYYFRVEMSLEDFYDILNC